MSFIIGIVVVIIGGSIVIAILKKMMRIEYKDSVQDSQILVYEVARMTFGGVLGLIIAKLF